MSCRRHCCNGLSPQRAGLHPVREPAARRGAARDWARIAPWVAHRPERQARQVRPGIIIDAEGRGTDAARAGELSRRRGEMAGARVREASACLTAGRGGRLVGVKDVAVGDVVRDLKRREEARTGTAAPARPRPRLQRQRRRVSATVRHNIGQRAAVEGTRSARRPRPAASSRARPAGWS